MARGINAEGEGVIRRAVMCSVGFEHRAASASRVPPC